MSKPIINANRASTYPIHQQRDEALAALSWLCGHGSQVCLAQHILASAAIASVTTSSLTAALFLLGGLFLVCLESSWAWRCCHFSPSYTTTFKLPCFSATCHHMRSSAGLFGYELSSQANNLAAIHGSVEGSCFCAKPQQAVRTAAADSQSL